MVWCHQCYVWYFEIFKMSHVSRSWWFLKPKAILVGDDVVTMYDKLDCIVFSYCDAAENWEIHSDFRFWPICCYRGTWPFTFDLENIWVVKVHLWVKLGWYIKALEGYPWSHAENHKLTNSRTTIFTEMHIFPSIKLGKIFVMASRALAPIHMSVLNYSTKLCFMFDSPQNQHLNRRTCFAKGAHG